MSKARYREQLDRVDRYYARFTAIDKGTPIRSVQLLQDDVYAFFQNCYHLKDWIINDNTVVISNKKRVVEETVKNSMYLSVCADICNGLKHLDRSDPRFPPKSGSQPRFGNKNITIYPNEEQGSILEVATMTVAYKVSTNYGEMDLYELATRCIEDWKRFVAEKIK